MPAITAVRKGVRLTTAIIRVGSSGRRLARPLHQGGGLDGQLVELDEARAAVAAPEVAA
jgi:hypothetical protein